MGDLLGFDNPSAAHEADEDNNTKPFGTTKKKGSGGGFQSMGLNFNVLKGIMKRGYKQPTPIQRKTIPLIMEGRDVVAMARTGSGKTACFLIPLLEKLKMRSAKAGARALVFSPTRELALQTLKFLKEIGRFVDLKSAVILGGDSMDDQFAAIHQNPDVIVATPGRFLHVCLEMELKLSSIEYVVFDEADRLYEMGLGEQLTEIVARLPDSRQTVLFSATLPKVLVEFARAGLSDPTLIRLDVETKIPEELQLWYITVRPEEKVAALLVLLKSHIDLNQQTVVFAATKHHVEYLHMILDRMGITNTYIYSNLDPAARKIHAAKFGRGRVKVLVVTDVAARGIDIPQLDNVINFNFPAKPKLFVHRVGRCARAGRSGTAYSLVTPDEYPYLLDLHLFLGRPLSITTATNRDGVVGKIPQNLLEEQHATLLTLHQTNMDLVSMKKVTENAMLRYLQTRPTASSDSNRRIKQMPFLTCAVLDLFKQSGGGVELEEEREHLLDRLKTYRPQGTIFEICGKNKSREYQVMKEKRAFHKEKIQKHHQKMEELQKEEHQSHAPSDQLNPASEELAKSTSDDIDSTFNTVILPKKRKMDVLYNNKKTKRQKLKDENYIPYAPSDQHTEQGLAVNNFQNEASRVQMDLTGDSEDQLKRHTQLKKWDRKKKKMVAVEDKRAGKIRTESGAWIPATYKSNRYANWKEKSKIANQENEGDEERGGGGGSGGFRGRGNNKMINTRWGRHNEKVQVKQRKSEMKNTDQILKARKLAAKKKQRKKKGGGSKGKGKPRGRK